MNAARTAWRVLVAPEAAWESIRAEGAPWSDTLRRHVLPLSLLPAAGWALRAGEWSLAQRAAALPLTVMAVLVSVVSLAAAFLALAPMYGLRRDWDRAVAVAGHGCTPVLACGLLFFSPLLASVGVVAMLQCFYLYFRGLQRVMGCRASDAAEYVAIGFLLSGAISGAIGYGASALGWF